MELLTVASWLLYLLLAGLVGWGLMQMRSAIKSNVPPPASLTHMEREMFIPFDLDDIVREVAQRDRHNAKEVCRQLAAFFNVEAGHTAAELRHGFALFDPQRTAPAHYTAEKILAKEERFLTLWRRILQKANFKPLSPEELDFALSENYLSTLPIDINYDNLDPELLKRFNLKHPLPEGHRAHKEHDRIWIYRRGIGVDKTTSYFPLEKANLLIELGVQWLCSKVMPKAPEKDKAPPTLGTHRAIGRVTLADVVDFKKNGIKKSLLEQNTLQEPTFREIVLLYRRKAPALPAPATAAATTVGASAAPQSPAPQSTPSTPRQDEKGAPLSRSNSLSPSTSGSTPPVRSPSTTGLAAAHRHREHKEKEHREHKERKEKSVSRSPSTAELSKSTSNSSVSSTVSSSAASADAKPAHQHAQMTSNPLGINIKTFINIPMADMEIIFPEKNVRMRPLDVVKFVATGAVAIITAITNMKQDASAMLAGGLVVMLIGLASKVYLDYTTALREYDNLLTRSLYDKSLNNNTGAVIYLVDQVAQQEAKEAVLAYCILLNKGPASSRKLDQRAEKFLYKMSRRSDVRQDIDFDVHDALAKLAQLGVVKREADGTYKALSAPEALAVLKSRWGEQLESEKEKEKEGKARGSAIVHSHSHH